MTASDKETVFKSPVLFGMSIIDLSQRLSEDEKDKNMDILLYADDLAILADSREMLQKSWIYYVLIVERII